MDVAPSGYRVALHARTSETVDEVNTILGKGWNFRDIEARDRFISTRLPRLFCLMYPLAKESRIIYPCLLFTLLFLLDDMLDTVPIHEAPSLYTRLFIIASGEAWPEAHRPEEIMMYNIFEEIRRKANHHVPRIMEACFTVVREQVVADRQQKRTLGEYMQHRLGDTGTMYSSPTLELAPPSLGRRPTQRPRCMCLGANGCGGFHRLVARMAAFAMDLDLTPQEQEALKPLEDNLGRHMILINDVYRHEKEVIVGNNEGAAAMSSAVLCLSEDAGFDYFAAKRILISMVREYENQNIVLVDQLVTKLGADSFEALRRDVRMYVQALRDAAAGNEAWNTETTAGISNDAVTRSLIANAPQITLTRPRLGSQYTTRSSSLQQQSASASTYSGSSRREPSCTIEENEEVTREGSPTPRKLPFVLRIDTSASGSNFGSFEPTSLLDAPLPRDAIFPQPLARSQSSTDQIHLPAGRMVPRSIPGPNTTQLETHDGAGPVFMSTTSGIPRAVKGPGIDYAIPGTMTTGATVFRQPTAPPPPMREVTTAPRQPTAAQSFLRSVSQMAFGRSRTTPQSQQSSPEDHPAFARNPMESGLGTGLGISPDNDRHRYRGPMLHASQNQSDPSTGSAGSAVHQRTTARMGLPRLATHGIFPAPGNRGRHHTGQGLQSYANVTAGNANNRPATHLPLSRAASSMGFHRSFPEPPAALDSALGAPGSTENRFHSSALPGQHTSAEERLSQPYEAVEQHQGKIGVSASGGRSHPYLNSQHQPTQSFHSLRSVRSPGDEISPPQTAMLRPLIPLPSQSQAHSEALKPSGHGPTHSSSGVVIRDPETGEVKKFASSQRKPSMASSHASTGSAGGAGSGELHAGSGRDVATRMIGASGTGRQTHDNGGDGDVSKSKDKEIRERKAAEMKEAVLKSLRKAKEDSGEEKE